MQLVRHTIFCERTQYISNMSIRIEPFEKGHHWRCTSNSTHSHAQSPQTLVDCTQTILRWLHTNAYVMHMQMHRIFQFMNASQSVKMPNKKNLIIAYLAKCGLFTISKLNLKTNLTKLNIVLICTKIQINVSYVGNKMHRVLLTLILRFIPLQQHLQIQQQKAFSRSVAAYLWQHLLRRNVRFAEKNLHRYTHTLKISQPTKMIPVSQKDALDILRP